MEKLQTPFYRIKEKDLAYDIGLLQSSLEKHWGKNYIMGYSVKTNSLPWLLNHLKEAGFYGEVVSDQEYLLCQRLGYAKQHMIYNGPIKDKAIFQQVLLDGAILNMDSNYELDWLEAFSKENPSKQFSVGLRVNCDIASLCPTEQLVEEEGGRFGYCYENGQLGAAIARIQALPNVILAGFHLHSSTQSRTVTVYGALAQVACNLAKEYGLDLAYVDMGGGYFGGRADKPSYPDYFAEICKVLKNQFDPQKTTIIAEPGVSLISRATTFETSVIDTKEIRNHTFVVTDGSRVNLNPQVTRHVYPHHMEYSSDPAARKTLPGQWICGATCMEYDRLFEEINGPQLVPGDRVIYDTAGGYTICLTPLFIHYFPAVYIEKEDGSIFTAREPWTNEEYLAKNYW